jgi:hypothetical protein
LRLLQAVAHWARYAPSTDLMPESSSLFNPSNHTLSILDLASSSIDSNGTKEASLIWANSIGLNIVRTSDEMANLRIYGSETDPKRTYIILEASDSKGANLCQQEEDFGRSLIHQLGELSSTTDVSAGLFERTYSLASELPISRMPMRTGASCSSKVSSDMCCV